MTQTKKELDQEVDDIIEADLDEVISLSNLSGLIAIFPGSCSSIILQCPNIALCSENDSS
jgi:hypothetical protein